MSRRATVPAEAGPCSWSRTTCQQRRRWARAARSRARRETRRRPEWTGDGRTAIGSPRAPGPHRRGDAAPRGPSWAEGAREPDTDDVPGAPEAPGAARRPRESYQLERPRVSDRDGRPGNAAVGRPRTGGLSARDVEMRGRGPRYRCRQQPPARPGRPGPFTHWRRTMSAMQTRSGDGIADRAAPGRNGLEPPVDVPAL